MDIKQIISDYHKASKQEKKAIKEKLEKEFAALPEDEKKEVQRIFLESREAVIQDAQEVLEELKLQKELEQVAQYVSMSYIAKKSFGKSRQWLNNRIKGNLVNGKPASFSKNELKQFSSTLFQLSDEIRNTALRIAR
jgi:hypothetical protein